MTDKLIEENEALRSEGLIMDKTMSGKEYRAEIHDAPQDEFSFAVMFLPVPGFPDDGPVDEIVRPVMKSVIAARCGFETDAGSYQEGWSFVHLEPREKECIGDAMVAAGVRDHEWKWCNLWFNLGKEQQEQSE